MSALDRVGPRVQKEWKQRDHSSPTHPRLCPALFTTRDGLCKAHRLPVPLTRCGERRVPDIWADRGLGEDGFVVGLTGSRNPQVSGEVIPQPVWEAVAGCDERLSG